MTRPGERHEITAGNKGGFADNGGLSRVGPWFSDRGLELAFQRANMPTTRQYLVMLGLVAVLGAFASEYGAWRSLPVTSDAFRFGTAWRGLLAAAAIGVVLFCHRITRPSLLYACNALVLCVGYVAIALRSSAPILASSDPSIFHATQNGLMLLLIVSMTQLTLVPGWLLANALIGAVATTGFIVVMNTWPDPPGYAFDASVVGAIGFLFIMGMGVSAQRLRRNSFLARLRLQRANLRLNELATQDDLTGCANRRHFYAIAEAELARSRRYRRAMSLVIFDVDHFKRINDHFGHAAGDRVLRRLTRAIGRELRELDTLGRVGGEEFGLLLPETAVEEAGRIAERLRGVIQDLCVDFDGRDLGVTASFGVTERRDDDDDIDALMRRADFALYEAKAAGRNRVVTGDVRRKGAGVRVSNRT